jgi:hypothetical protein
MYQRFGETCSLDNGIAMKIRIREERLERKSSGSGLKN